MAEQQQQQQQQQHAEGGSLLGQRWQGRVRKEINAPIARVWAISSDFCGLKKWVPTMEFCDKIEGEYQTPGCVRYAGGHTFKRTDGQKSWAKERLLSINNTNFCYSYAMEDGNMGFKGYIAQFQLFQGTNLDTTLVDWSFEMDPTAANKDEVIAKQIQVLSGGVDSLEVAAAPHSSLSSNLLSS